MRFLIVSYVFLPSIGGTEMATLALAQELLRRGHQVKVVTVTPAGSPAGAAVHPPADLGFEVIRKPSPWRLLALQRWADAVIHNGFTARFAWPLALAPRKWLTIHQTFLPQRWVHRLLARFTRNVANSRFLAGTLPVPSVVVPNSYRSEVFRVIDAGPRRYDLVFLGRLIGDKGPMVLMRALALLQARGVTPGLLVIGSGGEEQAMRAFVAQHGLNVEFAGTRSGDALARLLSQCRIMVVPSLWQEPFGIVALEGIACGCAVIGSAGGGLPEAIGPCGITFANGDVDALAEAIARLLGDASLLQSLRDAAPAHLARHTPQAIVDRYLDVLGMR